MYSFPKAAIINNHKLFGLKQQKFILSSRYQNLKSQCQNLKSQDHTSPQGSRDGYFLASSSNEWLQSFLDLWLQHPNFCLCLPMDFPLSFPLMSLIRTLVIGLGPTQVIQNDLTLKTLNYIYKDTFSK